MTPTIHLYYNTKWISKYIWEFLCEYFENFWCKFYYIPLWMTLAAAFFIAASPQKNPFWFLTWILYLAELRRMASEIVDRRFFLLKFDGFEKQ